MAQNGTPDTARRSILSHFYLLFAMFGKLFQTPVITYHSHSSCGTMSNDTKQSQCSEIEGLVAYKAVCWAGYADINILQNRGGLWRSATQHWRD